MTKTAVKVITKSAFEGMKKVNHLALDTNKISIIYGDSFEDMRELHSVYLSNNKIEFFHPDLLKNLPKLRNFLADYNKIEKLSAGMFRNNEKLEWISLQNNNLMDVQVDFSGFGNLLHVNLMNNLGDCDLKFDEQKMEVEERMGKLVEFQGNVEQFCRLS